MNDTDKTRALKESPKARPPILKRELVGFVKVSDGHSHPFFKLNKVDELLKFYISMYVDYFNIIFLSNRWKCTMLELINGSSHCYMHEV